MIPIAIVVLISASLLPIPALAGQIVNIIPHPQIGKGDLRSEMKASAKRLLGLCDSFNPDSFIAHIMYVNGLTSKDLMPQNAWARSLARKLDRRGVLTSKGRPQAGDLVFFSLSAETPHSSKAARQTVAVVEKVNGDQVTFIYAGERKVARGTLTLSGKKSNQTKFLQCTQKVSVKDAASKNAGGKSRNKKGKGGKDKKKTKKQKTTTKSLPCTAHDLLIGFADIEVAALTLNHTPPTSDLTRASEIPAEPDDPDEPDNAATEADPGAESDAESDAATGTGTVTGNAPLDNKTLDRILNDDGNDLKEQPPANK